MAAMKISREEPVLNAYAIDQYRKLLKEKDKYISLDDYCAKRNID
jgi:hypothetical protein